MEFVESQNQLDLQESLEGITFYVWVSAGWCFPKLFVCLFVCLCFDEGESWFDCAFVAVHSWLMGFLIDVDLVSQCFGPRS